MLNAEMMYVLYAALVVVAGLAGYIVGESWEMPWMGAAIGGAAGAGAAFFLHNLK